MNSTLEDGADGKQLWARAGGGPSLAILVFSQIAATAVATCYHHCCPWCDHLRHQHRGVLHVRCSGVQKTCRCGTSGHGLAGMGVLG